MAASEQEYEYVNRHYLRGDQYLPAGSVDDRFAVRGIHSLSNDRFLVLRRG
jgi:hypothetical protein